ncbi:MAG TPA: helix-turn-helix transcriptional regulator [Hanamia sp.]|nr:helix-turn-helix transcriptional regulator [Hanamia sp.]
MPKYKNIQETIRVGENIRTHREKAGFTQDDLASMTGFAKSTIASIEAGANTDISHLIEIAKAIGVHPKEVFNIPFEIAPRYKLSPNRIDRVLVTKKIRDIINESSFFYKPKLVREVVNYLYDETGLKVNPTHISVVLKRFSQEGKLKYKKEGRNNLYMVKKKKNRDA